MHPDLEENLIKLSKQGDVFVCRKSDLEGDDWKEYQERELKYWQNKYDSGYYPDYKESFHRTLAKFGVDANYFANKRLLEVGCGPQGFSAGLVQLNENQPKIHVIVDPLLDKYQDFSTFSLFGKKTIKIAALGEYIPVPPDFFDVVVCQNVLDHVNKPSLVVSEIHRSLKKNGIALVSVHTLSSLCKLFGPVINWIDKNHPHHFTDRNVLRLFDAFRVVTHHSLPLGDDNPNIAKEMHKSLKKYLAAGLLRTTYLKAQKL